MEFSKWIPVIGLMFSIYSAIFSTVVLYPWHIELSDEFSELSKNVLNASFIRCGV